MKRLDHYWQTRNPLALGLLPLAGLFCLVAELRAAAYRSGMLVRRRLPVPVLVVGNVTVGGTGKTPLVIWLARHLAAQGRRPGILTRGYRGAAQDWPRRVRADADPVEVGDEAVLLARRAGCPVAAGPDRVDSGRLLLDEAGCDVLICDDGLQHYALERDLEIALVDGERRFGNGFCLPAGPLRERAARLRRTDLVLVNGIPRPGEMGMELRMEHAVALGDRRTSRPLADFRGRPVTALAGIGNPGRFFGALRRLGLDPREAGFPDHHAFAPGDLAALADTTVLMTEKDAVKCEAFPTRDCWYVPVDTIPDPAFVKRLDLLLRGLIENG